MLVIKNKYIQNRGRKIKSRKLCKFNQLLIRKMKIPYSKALFILALERCKSDWKCKQILLTIFSNVHLDPLLKNISTK